MKVTWNGTSYSHYVNFELSCLNFKHYTNKVEFHLNSRANINLKNVFNFNFLNKISGSKDQFAVQFIPSCNDIIQKYKTTTTIKQLKM